MQRPVLLGDGELQVAQLVGQLFRIGLTQAEPAEQAALLLVLELDAQPPVVACHQRNAR